MTAVETLKMAINGIPKPFRWNYPSGSRQFVADMAKYDVAVAAMKVEFNKAIVEESK